MEQLQIQELHNVSRRYRQRARAFLHEYREWKNFYDTTRAADTRVFLRYEGQSLRQQVTDMFKMYRMAQSDYMRAYHGLHNHDDYVAVKKAA